MRSSSGYFSEGARRLLQRHPAMAAERSRDLAVTFQRAQVEVCRRVTGQGHALARMAGELQSGQLDYFREGSDRDRKRGFGKKASFRYAGFAPSHIAEFLARRQKCASGHISPAELSAREADFLFGFTFEVIEQVARRAYPLPAGSTTDIGIESALVAARRLRDEIVLGNLLLVAKVAMARSRRHPEHVCDDLFAAGVDGLMIAIHRYDPAVGHFSTYAVPWIKAAIGRYIANTSHLIRIPVGLQDRVRLQCREAEKEGAGPAARRIPEVQSLEEPLPGAAGRGRFLQDVLGDVQTAAPSEAAERVEITRALRQRLRDLDLVTQFIIALRNDFGDAASLGEALFRQESELSLERGRAIATESLKLVGRPSVIQRMESVPPLKMAEQPRGEPATAEV